MEHLKMLLESYNDGLVIPDIDGRIWGFIHWFLVELPLGLLRIIVSMIAFVMELLDFSALFEPMRRRIFEQSRIMFIGFIGGENGYIRDSSVAFVFLLITGIYLFFQYFSKRGNFSKKALHALIVVLVGFAYFGRFNVNGQLIRGGNFMMETVSNVVSEMSEHLISDIPVTGNTDSLSDRNSFAHFYEEHILMTTFNFVNSGAMDGCYIEDECLDMSRLIPPGGLSGEELRNFEENRQSYIDSIADDNPFVRRNGDMLIQRMLATQIGFINAFVLAKPVFFILLTLAMFEVVILVLLLLVPFALMFSFLPWFQNAFFKVLKMIMGIMFLPILLTLLLSIVFYLNTIVDQFILSSASLILGTDPMTIGGLPRGYMGLVIHGVIIVVKLFLIRVAWKNKGALLKLVSDNKVDDTYIDMPAEYAQETYESAKDTALGGAKTAVGAYTGNPALVQDGLEQMQGAENDYVLNDPNANKDVENTEELEPIIEDETGDDVLHNEDTLDVDNVDAEIETVETEMEQLDEEIDMNEYISDEEIKLDDYIVEDDIKLDEYVDSEIELNNDVSNAFDDLESEFENKQTTLNGKGIDFNTFDDLENSDALSEYEAYHDLSRTHNVLKNQHLELKEMNVRDHLFSKDNLDMSSSTVSAEYVKSFSNEMDEIREMFASD